MILQKRIERLEAGLAPAGCCCGHRVIGASEYECEARRRAMIESGQAGAWDLFIFRVLVGPEQRVQ